jgi:hypothetical protein
MDIQRFLHQGFLHIALPKIAGRILFRITGRFEAPAKYLAVGDFY